MKIFIHLVLPILILNLLYDLQSGQLHYARVY